MNLKKLKFKEAIVPSKTLTFVFWGFIIIIFGASFNFTAVTENGGRMPVWISNNIDIPTHFSIEDIDKVNSLQFADIYHIGNWVVSIGDFLLFIGLFLVFLGLYMNIHNSVVNTLMLRKLKNETKTITMKGGKN
jgi:uncharacterized membrane protein